MNSVSNVREISFVRRRNWIAHFINFNSKEANKIVPLHTGEVLDPGSKTGIAGIDVVAIKVVVSDSASLSK